MRSKLIPVTLLVLFTAACLLAAGGARRRPRVTPPKAASSTVKDAAGQLRAPEPEDRIAALRALAANAVEASSAIPAIVGLLSDCGEAGEWERPDRVSDAAVSALVAVGRPAIGPLAKVLDTGDVLVKRRAAVALALMRNDEANAALIGASSSKDLATRRAAADALGGTSPEVTAALVRLLKDPDATIRMRAVRGLAREPDVLPLAPVITALKDTDPRVRMAAVGALAAVPEARVREALLPLLKDETPTVRAATARALGSQGSSQDMSALVTLLGDPDPQVRAAAADTLGSTMGRGAVEPLIAALKDPSDRVKEAAVSALSDTGDRRAREPLLAAFGDQAMGVRLAVIDAVGESRMRPVVELLTGALKDPNPEVRLAVLTKLSNLTPQLGTRAKPVRSAIVGLIADEDPRIRVAAIQFVGTDDRRVLDLLLTAARDRQPQVRQVAVAAIGHWEEPRTVEALSRALRDPDPDVRFFAVEALGQFARLAPAKALIGALDDPSRNVRMAAIRALGRSRDPQSVKALIGALHDGTWEFRRAAAAALGGTWSDDAVAALAAALRDSSVSVRETAVQALGGTQNDKVVGPLIGALQDSSPAIRAAAADALATFSSDQTFEALLGLMKDDNAEVRAGAASGMGAMGDPRAEDALKVAMNDDNIEVRRAAAAGLSGQGYTRARGGMGGGGRGGGMGGGGGRGGGGGAFAEELTRAAADAHLLPPLDVAPSARGPASSNRQYRTQIRFRNGYQGAGRATNSTAPHAPEAARACDAAPIPACSRAERSARITMEDSPVTTPDPVTAVYNACNPAVVPTFDHYEDCSSARGGMRVADLMARQIRRSQRSVHLLFSGHLGGGKSTELQQLKRALEASASGRNPLLCVYIDAEDFVDIYDVELTDILLGITAQVAQDLRKRVGVELKSSYFVKRWDELKDLLLRSVEFDKAEFSFQNLAKLSGSLKKSPGFRTEVREKLRPQEPSLLDEVNLLLEQANAELRKQRNYDGLVLVLDNLEKIIEKKDEPSGRTSHYLLFVARGEQLHALGCHAVYTVPLALLRSPNGPALQSIFGETARVLPAVKIADKDGTAYVDGIEHMRRILHRRFEEVKVAPTDVFDSPRICDELCRMSGGNMRQLLMLFRSACDYVDTLPITEEALGRAVQNAANAFAASIGEQHWQCLADLHNDPSKRIRNDVDHHEMLYGLGMLEYLNGEEPWGEVNPLVRKLSHFRDLIRAAAPA